MITAEKALILSNKKTKLRDRVISSIDNGIKRGAYCVELFITSKEASCDSIKNELDVNGYTWYIEDVTPTYQGYIEDVTPTYQGYTVVLDTVYKLTVRWDDCYSDE